MKFYHAEDGTWTCEFMCVDVNGEPYKRTISGNSKREVKRWAKEAINENREAALQRRRQPQTGESKSDSGGQSGSDWKDELAGCALEGCVEMLIDMIFGR